MYFGLEWFNLECCGVCLLDSFASTSIFVLWSIRIWIAWSIKSNEPHKCGMCLSIIIPIPSKCLHLLARSWQSQYEHWSDTLYHIVGVVMLKILNQYEASSTICIVEVSSTYLFNILSASLSRDLWFLQFAQGANRSLSHISCHFLSFLVPLYDRSSNVSASFTVPY